jgi:4-hydroxymandelate oxidase
MSRAPFNRRQALAGFTSLLAAAPLLKSQDVPVPELIGEEPGRIAPYDDLANTFEFEPMAKRRLNPELFAAIADGDHSAWDRITFRQRMADTTGLDLTTDLFGDAHFTPIMVGAVSHQNRFHPDGELAMAEGCSAGNAGLIVSDRSDHSIEEIAAKATSSLWYQVYPEADVAALTGRIRQAKAAGCKAICLTVGSPGSDSSIAADWDYVDRIRQATDAPFLLKGVMSAEEAQQAADKGVNGIVVSNHGGKFLSGVADTITVLPSITEALNGRIPVLIDGGVRRGADVLKALALGATAALVARPALWALTAYGAEGVQKVIELLQTELASDMTMLGTINPAAVTRDHVKIHRR